MDCETSQSCSGDPHHLRKKLDKCIEIKVHFPLKNWKIILSKMYLMFEIEMFFLSNSNTNI